MHAIVCGFLILVAAPSFAQVVVHVDQDELPINSGSELRDWCHAESEARFVGEGKTPYNWTAQHLERGNTLVVEGQWRVDNARVSVKCRIARGARREYATLDVTPAN